MKSYIIISKVSIAVMKDDDEQVVGKFLLKVGDKFKVAGDYSYYESEGEYWNTVHPRIKVGTSLFYNVPPDCYIYLDEAEITSIADLTDRILLRDLSIDYYIMLILKEYFRLQESYSKTF